MSDLDRIYQKYIGVFYEVDGGGTWLDLSAVRYALRAALKELAEANKPAAEPTQNRQQIERINAWLREHAPDDFWTDDDAMTSIIAAADRLRGQVARLQAMLAAADADVQRSNARLEQLIRINDWIISYAADAIAAADRLRGTVERLRIELETAIDERNVADAACAGMEAEVAGLRSQLAAMDADNAKLAQELAILRSWSVAPHGNGAITDDFGTVITNPPSTLTLSWPGDLADWVEGLEKGRHDWRKLAKPVRWQLIANVVNQVKDSVEFDAQRPQWMSTSRAAALTFGDGRWDKVVERAHAGEVLV